MSNDFRFGFVGIVGRPNVGKSSLVNRMTGVKVTITSRRPQTTRSRVLGIVNQPNAQLVLVDTPGFHRSTGHLNRLINRTARNSIFAVDALAMVIDARGWRPSDSSVIQMICMVEQPIFLLINKIDLLSKAEQVLPLISECNERGNFVEIIPVSAKTGHNLDTVLQLVQLQFPIASAGFPLGQASSARIEFSVAELVREQVFRLAGAEIPYKSAVTVNPSEGNRTKKPSFHADIWVESEGQKAILVGAGGKRLKNIGIRSRRQIEKMLGTEVILTTRVKVRQGWSSNLRQLRSLGYEDYT